MSKEQKKKPQFKMSDNVTIKRIDNITGKILDEETYHNLITDTGLARLADLISGDSIVGFSDLAIGEGTTSPVAGDTALENQSKTASATVTQPTANQIKFEHLFTFGTGESFNITEAGVLSSESSPTLLNRLTFAAKAVDSNTDLSVVITITVDRP